MTHIAHKTLAHIDEMLKSDQGAKFRETLGRVLPHIGDAYRGLSEDFRDHLGASILGQECARSILLSWRWATVKKFDGRMVRLFNRGHLEEGRFIALLLAIGCEVYQQDGEGKQFKIEFADGYGGGSGDGLCKNLPDLAESQFAICEFKTHGEKSFIKLAGKLDDWRKHLANPELNQFTGDGVQLAKPEHYYQMQMYMGRMGIASSLYMAVCKNTDDVYAEVVAFDRAALDYLLNRADTLVQSVNSVNPIARINQSPGYFKCRFCDHRPVCHLDAEPAKNCRTCGHVSLCGSGSWRCAIDGAKLSPEEQRAACDKYVVERHM